MNDKPKPAIRARSRRQTSLSRSVINDALPVYSCADPDQDFIPPWLGSVVRDLAPRVGQIRGIVQGKTRGLGTAWPIARHGQDTLFITAGHVLQLLVPQGTVLMKAADIARINPPCSVTLPDGRMLRLRRWVCSAPQDLALFLVEGAVEPLPLADHTRDNAEICVLGYPVARHPRYDGLGWEYLDRLCVAPGLTSLARIYPTTYPVADYLMHHASTLAGFSGGPVVDAQGQAVGLHVWGQGQIDDRDRNDAVRIESILNTDWLAAILNGQSETAPEGAVCHPFQGAGDPGIGPAEGDDLRG